jgi:hypothetical protein
MVYPKGWKRAHTLADAKRALTNSLEQKSVRPLAMSSKNDSQSKK